MYFPRFSAFVFVVFHFIFLSSGDICRPCEIVRPLSTRRGLSSSPHTPHFACRTCLGPPQLPPCSSEVDEPAAVDTVGEARGLRRDGEPSGKLSCPCFPLPLASPGCHPSSPRLVNVSSASPCAPGLPRGRTAVDGEKSGQGYPVVRFHFCFFPWPRLDSPKPLVSRA